MSNTTTTAGRRSSADREQQQREREQARREREQHRRERDEQLARERRARDERRERDQQRRLLDELGPSSRVAGASDPTTIEAGANAEQRAVDALVAEGYEIVERNYRCDVGELDIIARDGDDLVFVEVRSRSSTDHGGASEAVGHHKQRKVSKVAEVYLKHMRPWFDACRFDVVAINGDDARDIEIYKDAWRGGLLR